MLYIWKICSIKIEECIYRERIEMGIYKEGRYIYKISDMYKEGG